MSSTDWAIVNSPQIPQILSSGLRAKGVACDTKCRQFHIFIKLSEFAFVTDSRVSQTTHRWTS